MFRDEWSLQQIPFIYFHVNDLGYISDWAVKKYKRKFGDEKIKKVSHDFNKFLKDRRRKRVIICMDEHRIAYFYIRRIKFMKRNCFMIDLLDKDVSDAVVFSHMISCDEYWGLTWDYVSERGHHKWDELLHRIYFRTFKDDRQTDVSYYTIET